MIICMLKLVATPIGNLADVSPAMITAWQEADIVAAEDTRNFIQLLRRLELKISAQILSYYDQNEVTRAKQLLAELESGKSVVVVTDAGMPVVSDPGFRLVELAIAAGIEVSVVPGPSAVLTALALSGLATDRFAFEGFLSRKSGARRRHLEKLAEDERTLIFFEAPHRLKDFLKDLAEVFGARQIAVCRELTKTYEQVIRGEITEVLANLNQEVRGEITVVVSGANRDLPKLDLAAAVAKVQGLVAAGIKLKAAVTEIAKPANLNKAELYDAVVAAKKLETEKKTRT